MRKAIDRRAFFKMAAGTVAFMSGGSVAFGSDLPKSIKRSLASLMAADLPKLDGVFVFDEAVCRAMATDFGHHVHRLPIGVLFPKSTGDIQKIVKYATKNKFKVAMRGHGCSAYGQTQVEAGIVIDAADFNSIEWASQDSIRARPGATWHDIMSVALEHGKMPPVFPDLLFLTVGGTLSAGGIGETSYRLGAQVEHVTELEVVTGKGEIQICSKNKNRKLFDAVLGGMGQCGLVTRATVRVIPAPKNVATREFQYTDRVAFLDDLAKFARAENEGAIVGKLAKSADGKWTQTLVANTWIFGDSEKNPPAWVGEMTGKSTGEAKLVTFETYANRGAKTYLDSVANGTILIPHPYMSFFLPDSAAGVMVDDLLGNPEASVGAVAIPVFPMLTKNFTQPLQRMPASELVYHIRVYRKAAVEASPEHLKMIKMNVENFLPRIFSSGGTVYPPHSPILSQDQWRQHFGEKAWSSLKDAKQAFDPAQLLNPGAGIFA